MNRLLTRHFSLLLLSVTLSLALLPGRVNSQKPISVGFLGEESEKQITGERKAAWEFLKNSPGINEEYLTLKQASKNNSGIGNYSIIWYHRPDSGRVSDVESNPKLLESLKKYVIDGGNLLLTLDAIRLLPLLGIESTAPEARYVQATDQGYGRKLGFHSFRAHPLFDSLYGGATLFAPDKDMPVRQMGWFDGMIPSGRTVAVDWAYINILENTKLVTEYSLGKGKVLAIGAYMLFEPFNYNRAQLGVFTRNCFQYLTGNLQGDQYYWDYEANRVIPFRSTADSVQPENATAWLPGSERITLKSKYAGSNQWDIAGEQILLMGKEKGGIDEIWAHPFMALRDYEVGIRFSFSDSIYWLNEQRPEIEVRPESFTRIYRFRRAYLTEIITGHPTEATAIAHYELRSLYPAQLIVKMKSNLRFMWPYSGNVTGQIRYDWNEGLNSFIFRDKSGSFVSLAGSNRKPLQHAAGQYENFAPVVISPNIDRMVRADSAFYGLPTDKFQASALMVFELGANDNLDMVLSASAIGIQNAVDHYKTAIKRPMSVYLASMRYNNSLFDKKLGITSPVKSFNEGFQWAIVGTDRFFVNTPGIGRSLVAGYATTDFGWDGGQKVSGRPGYAWYFGRDGVWSSFAVLDYGDFEKVKSVLELYSNYQDISGKIYHELTTSGVAHYDAADATPLYISLAGKYLHHTGDTAFIRQQWPYVKKALNYCYSTDTDGDHLIENTLVGHGWEEGGALFGTHTTFYLASCWAEALNQASYMANALGMHAESQKYARDYGEVLRIMNTDFWNPSTNFFYHGKYKNGTYHPEPDVMAAVPLLFDQVLDSAKWNPVLQRLASSNFSTDWGVRILGENSSFFKPGSYHQGSVWPLFTGWTSLAEFEHGRSSEGYSHMMNNLLTYQGWSLGFVPEVLHGTEYKPFGVCAHQCWSETMVLQPAIEGMLGLQPDAMENRLTLSPQFPADWDTVSVQNIRIADRRINLTMHQTAEKSVWILRRAAGSSGKTQFRLNLSYPAGTKIHRVLVNGKEAEPELLGSRLGLNLVLDGEVKVEIFKKGGICALPELREIKPGYTSEGSRIISEELKGNTYTLRMDGKSGTDTRFRLFAPEGFDLISDRCRLIAQEGSVYTYEFQFPLADSKYITVPLTFTIK